jgi:hypothetical protein
MSDLTFTARTEEEINAINLLEPGECDFEVAKAVSKKSKASGNPMIELTLKVWDIKGKEKTIFDYLINIPSMEYKIKHFCDSVGLDEDYQAGSLSAVKCEGKFGKLKLTIAKDKSGQYPDKNAVQDYVKSVSKKTNGTEQPPFDDDIPF